MDAIKGPLYVAGDTLVEALIEIIKQFVVASGAQVVVKCVKVPERRIHASIVPLL